MFIIGGNETVIGLARNMVQDFNLLTNTWTLINSLNLAVCDPFCMEYNGFIYLFGGRINYHTRTYQVQIFNPVSYQFGVFGEMPCRH